MVGFSVLGPLTVERDGQELPLRTPLLRRLLAVLLAASPRRISADELADVLWGQGIPPSARKTLQVYIHRLRVALGAEEILDHYVGGYRMVVQAPQLDATAFTSLLTAAAESRHASELDDTERLLSKALQMWRGPAYDGFVDLPFVGEAAVRLEEQRLRAWLDHVEVRMELGRHQQVVAELQQVAMEQPYREDVTAQLMLALYRSGRQADALAVYREARKLLGEELGIAPGVPLQQLHEAILCGDRGLIAARRLVPLTAPGKAGPGDPPMTRPQMLPIDLPDFLGRAGETRWLRDRLPGSSSSSTVVAVSGRAGVGKSVLCIHAAHMASDRYPDGQLFATLHGTAGDRPAHPLEVLGRFLRALGAASAPDDFDERLDLYRLMLADRRILIVLDNVGSADQVLPLIPGSPTCDVIVNSRTRLAPALGAEALDLDIPDPHQALDLLAHIAGEQRIEQERAAAQRLTQLCGYLPLAIRIAGAKLITKPHWSLSTLVGHLDDEQHRLDQLSFEQLDVRSSLALSYGGLNQRAQTLFRRLGDLNLTTISVWAAAALLDTSCNQAEDLLEVLYDAQLVDTLGREQSGQARYRLHDLVRLLARQYASEEEQDRVLQPARQRTYGAWLYLLDQVHHRVFGGNHENIHNPAARWTIEQPLAGSLIDEPLKWFDMERSNIIEMIHRAATDGQSMMAWGLACTASPLFQMRRCFDDWKNVLDTAYSSCEDSADLHGCAAMRYRQGEVFADRQEYRLASDHFQTAVTLFERASDRHGAAVATVYTAMIDRWDGLHELALQRYGQALGELRQHNDPGTEALALRGIGQIHLDRNDHPSADAYLTRALGAARLAGSARHIAQVLFWRGMLRIRQSRFDEAEQNFVEVSQLTRALGDRPGEAQAIRGMGLSCKGRGDLKGAAARLNEALHLVSQPRPTLLERWIRDDLAELHVMPTTAAQSKNDGSSQRPGSLAVDTELRGADKGSRNETTT